jgi:hypothetical protein
LNPLCGENYVHLLKVDKSHVGRSFYSGDPNMKSKHATCVIT